MKNTIRLLLLSVVFVLSNFAKNQANAQSISQDVISSSGTFVETTSASMAWTIGEVITETYSSSFNFFTQGFHQPKQTYCTASSVSELQSRNILVYPNPVVDVLYIDFGTLSGFKHINIYDLMGKEIRKDVSETGSGLLKVSVADFASGSYLLVIDDKDRGMNSYFKFNVIK